MKGLLIFTQPDENGDTVVFDFETRQFGKVVNQTPTPPLPEPESEEASSDKDGCFKVLLLLIGVGLTVVTGMVQL